MIIDFILISTYELTTRGDVAIQFYDIIRYRTTCLVHLLTVIHLLNLDRNALNSGLGLGLCFLSIVLLTRLLISFLKTLMSSLNKRNRTM